MVRLSTSARRASAQDRDPEGRIFAGGRSLDDVSIIAAPGQEWHCPKDMVNEYARLGMSEIVLVCLAQSVEELNVNMDAILTDALGIKKVH